YLSSIHPFPTRRSSDLIDFSGDAQKVGLVMRPAQLLIFGNPKAGTPLMIVSPSIAIDLPLKALAWEDGDGKVNRDAGRDNHQRRSEEHTSELQSRSDLV